MKVNLSNGESVEVGFPGAATGYVCESVELRGRDVTAMRKLFEADKDRFYAFLMQFENRFVENRYPNMGK